MDDDYSHHPDIPEIKTIPATQDVAVHDDLPDMAGDAPFAARTRRKTPDAKAYAVPAARTEIVSPGLNTTAADPFGVLSSPASVNAKKELAALETHLSEPNVSERTVPVESEHESELPFDAEQEEEESSDEADADTDNYVPPPALRARGKSAEPGAVKDKTRERREFEEALAKHREQEREQVRAASEAVARKGGASTRRSRREQSAPAVEPERRQREKTPAAQIEPTKLVPPSSKRAAVRQWCQLHC